MAIKLFEDYHPDHHGARAANIVMRRATPADIVTIAPYQRPTRGPAACQYVGEFEREFDAIELGKVQRLLYVAEIGGAIVGFSRSSYLPTHEIDGARAMPQGWYLNGVTVDPVWRRCGVGHAITVHRIARYQARRLYLFCQYAQFGLDRFAYQVRFSGVDARFRVAWAVLCRRRGHSIRTESVGAVLLRLRKAQVPPRYFKPAR